MTIDHPTGPLHDQLAASTTTRHPTTPASALAIAASEGIHRLSLPTPFLVGRVNCWLIEDDPLTLVDTGPNSGKTLDELERALEQRGRTIEQLELIVITHQHMDHLGLLEILSRRSGAEVAALHLLTPYLTNFPAGAVADDAFAYELMRRHGIPADLTTVLGGVGAAFRAFGSSGRVTHELRDGDTLMLRDRRLKILHRPGHSPSDTVLWDPDRRIAIGGDHLLAHISSNPLVSRPLSGSADGRPRALLQYMESLRATREMPLSIVLSGHGDPIVDHAGLIDERFRLHDRRAEKIHQLLMPRPLTAYELAGAMWGNIAVTQAFLTLSEVLGHLDLLVQRGVVSEEEGSGTSRFHAVR